MSIPVVAVLNHWSHVFQDFSLSAEEFYASLQEVVTSQQMPDAQVGRITHKEGGMFSSSRIYLRVKYRDLVFDVCAAPFGKNFFISWWLYETQGMMMKLMGNSRVGNILQARAAKRTFFQADAEQMFKDCVHTCVLDTVEKVTEGKSVRQLNAGEKVYKEGGL